MTLLKTLFIYAIFTVSVTATASLKSKTLEYKQGDTTLEGYLAFDDSFKGARPGILVVHDWMGQGAYSKKRADMLAGLGYIAFSADIYGKGIRPKDAKEAGALATTYKTDRNLLRARVIAALNQLLKEKNVNQNKIAAIGYCFGGTTVLELARAGAKISGVVSFHGGLSTPTPADAKNIKGHVLVLHGADDPFVNAEEVAGFEKEMREAKVDWQLVKYSNAVHSFTNKEAGNDNSKGAAYNKKADERSWIAMQNFFKEIF